MLLLSAACVVHGAEKDPDAARLGHAAEVLQEIMQAPDKAFPRNCSIGPSAWW